MQSAIWNPIELLVESKNTWNVFMYVFVSFSRLMIDSLFFCFFLTISRLIVCVSIPFPNFVIECTSKFYQQMHPQILSANAPNKMSCQPKDTRYGWCKWLQECTCFHFYQYSEQCSVNINRFYLAWSVLQSGKYCTTKLQNYKFTVEFTSVVDISNCLSCHITL